MGSRAVMAFKNSTEPSDLGVYVHWIGSPEMIERVIAICVERGYRTFASDPQYAFARLVVATCEVAGKGKESGVGVGKLKDLDRDNGDNGMYLIDPNSWSIVGRKFNR